MANAKRSARASARLSRIARAPRARVEAQRTGPTVQVVRGGSIESLRNAWNHGHISISEVPSHLQEAVCQ